MHDTQQGHLPPHAAETKCMCSLCSWGRTCQLTFHIFQTATILGRSWNPEIAQCATQRQAQSSHFTSTLSLNWYTGGHSYRHVKIWLTLPLMLILVLLVDPVTGQPETAISLRSFTSLASLDIGSMDVGQGKQLDLLRAALSTWRSTSMSRTITLDVKLLQDRQTRDTFLALMDQIGHLMEVHCSGSFV